MASVNSNQTSNQVNKLFQIWSNRSLRTKMALAFATTILLSIGVIAFINNRTTTTALTAQVESNLTSLAEAKAVNIGDLLAQQVNLLQTLSLTRGLHDRLALANTSYGTDPVEIQANLNELDQQWIAADDTDFFIHRYQNNAPAAELQTFREAFPDHVEVFITDQHGGLLATTNRTSDFYQADEAWWQAAYNNGQGGIYIGEPEFDESSNTLGVNMAVPIHAKDTGEIIGILRTTYDLTALTRSVAQFQFADTGQIDLLISENQMITVESDGEFEVVQVEPTNLAELEETRETIAEFDFDGEPNLVVQAPVATTLNDPTIANLGWRLIVHQTKSEALTIVDQQTRNTGLLGIVVSAITIVVALILGRQLTDPLTNLTRTVTRLAKGNLQARAPVKSNDEIGVLATHFNQMAEQLQRTLAGLEQQVAERTQATRNLEISANVSRRLSTILDEKQLVSEVVEQVRLAFDYYYAHIYIFDEAKEKLVMTGGTGESGQTMLARGHTLDKGQGLVGRAAETNTIVLVQDVAEAEGWLPNPLLPDTKAEVAVPIALGEEVLGVLDVQHNVAGSLTQTQADLIQGIANQVAVALRNARTYARAQRQVEREVLVNTISQKIQGATTVDNAMQIAVRELGRALGKGRTQVRLKVAQSENEQM